MHMGPLHPGASMSASMPQGSICWAVIESRECLSCIGQYMRWIRPLPQLVSYPWLEEMVFLRLNSTSYVLPISSFCCRKAFHGTSVINCTWFFTCLNRKCYFYGNTQHYVHACDGVRGQHVGQRSDRGQSTWWWLVGWGISPDWGLETGQQM